MAFNVELAKKVRTLIAEEPRKLDMDTWSRRVDPSVIGAPPCGTLACLAGWLIFAARPELMDYAGRLNVHLFYDEGGKHVDEYAAELLGMPVGKCPFYRTKWGAPEVLGWLDGKIAEAESAKV